MAGLHRYHGKNGKYLVLRRDGTIPEWPNFVLGANDPCAPAALRMYAKRAQAEALDPVFVHDIRRLADEFDAHRIRTVNIGAKVGDPDAPLHRKDDPRVIKAMDTGRIELAPTIDRDPPYAPADAALGDGAASAVGLISRIAACSKTTERIVGLPYKDPPSASDALIGQARDLIADLEPWLRKVGSSVSVEFEKRIKERLRPAPPVESRKIAAARVPTGVDQMACVGTTHTQQGKTSVSVSVLPTSAQKCRWSTRLRRACWAMFGKAIGREADFVDVVFDGGPGPDGGRFVECEDPQGRSVFAGRWLKQAGSEFWALRIALRPRRALTQAELLLAALIGLLLGSILCRDLASIR